MLPCKKVRAMITLKMLRLPSRITAKGEPSSPRLRTTIYVGMSPPEKYMGMMSRMVTTLRPLKYRRESGKAMLIVRKRAMAVPHTV